MCWLFELTSSFDALSVRAVHKVTQRTQTNPVCCGTHHDKKKQLEAIALTNERGRQTKTFTDISRLWKIDRDRLNLFLCLMRLVKILC